MINSQKSRDQKAVYLKVKRKRQSVDSELSLQVLKDKHNRHYGILTHTFDPTIYRDDII